MEQRDKFFAIITFMVTMLSGYIFNLDYLKIAESGLTLSSIVLAVYIAAIIGLINTDLAKNMQKTITGKGNDKTQLGVLTNYFQKASACAIGTILISSIILLMRAPTQETAKAALVVWKIISACGLALYIENLVFLTTIIRFMLNRQIWNK